MTNMIKHSKFDLIKTMVEKDIPTLLVGGAGSGKNHTLEQVADELNLDFYFSNAVTQEHRLTGFKDAHGVFHETQFYQAFTNGGLFFLDEVDGSIPEALLILNSAIANKYFDFPIGRVVAHEDFRVVGAGNTYGTGADHIYVGRQQLDGATIDRFVVIDFDYDKAVEDSLASNEDIVPFIHTLRSIAEERALPYVFSMRAIITASKLDNIISDVDVVRMAIFKSIQKEEIEMFIDLLPSGNRYTNATYILVGLEPEKKPSVSYNSYDTSQTTALQYRITDFLKGMEEGI